MHLLASNLHRLNSGSYSLHQMKPMDLLSYLNPSVEVCCDSESLILRGLLSFRIRHVKVYFGSGHPKNTVDSCNQKLILNAKEWFDN